MINVLIADDHPTLRQGLRQLIQEQPDMTVVGEATNGQEALELIHKDGWNVLVLDISMPLRSGLEVLHEVRHYKPGAPVLMLSMYPEEQFGIRVLKAGAAGYMTKENVINDLISAIRKVVHGGKYVSATMAEHLGHHLTEDQPTTLHERLSDREYDVLCLMAQGKSHTTIGQELALSPKTISTYRARLLVKLGLKTNSDLIRYVMEHDLLQPKVMIHPAAQ